MVEKYKQRIGFDLDGVLIDHKKNRKIIAREMGYKKVTRNTSMQELQKVTSRRDYVKIQKYIYGMATLSTEAMGQSRQALKILSKNYDLFIISRRQKGHRLYARQWLNKHFFFNARRIFFVNKDSDKAKTMDKLAIDIYIDDKISVLENASKKVNKFLFDKFRAYRNKNLGDIKVVHSFRELVKLIK